RCPFAHVGQGGSGAAGRLALEFGGGGAGLAGDGLGVGEGRGQDVRPWPYVDRGSALAQLGTGQRASGVEELLGDGRAQRAFDEVGGSGARGERSEEHTSELQSRENLVCR